MMNRYAAILLIALCAAPAVSGEGVEQGAIEQSVAAPAEVHPAAAGIRLEVSGGEAVRFQIFSITGQAVKTVMVLPGETMHVELPRGYYIVKCEHFSKRILVK